MALRKWLILTKWLGWLWLSTLVIFVALTFIAFRVSTGAVEEMREGWRAKDLGMTVHGVREIASAGEICRIGLALPAPQTLRWVPGVSQYLHAAEHACSAAKNIGAATKTPSARVLISSFETRELSGATLADKALIEYIFEAITSSSSFLRQAASDLDALSQISLRNSMKQRVQRVAAVLTKQRVENIIALGQNGPTVLGVDRPRTYFVALLSNAEMRAGGGFLGQYAIMRFENGTATIEKSGSNASLPPVAQQNPALIGDMEQLVGVNNPEWVNINLSPHGPDAGSSAVRSWFLGTGQILDGYIAIDVTAASRLAAAAGESITTAKGARVSGAAAIAAYAQNGIYFDFASPSEAAGPRKAYQVAVFQQLLRQVVGSLTRLDSLVSTLPKAIDERRVTFWFRDSKLQSAIAKSPAARDIREEPHAVSVTFNNGSGNKFDYYLQLDAKVSCYQNEIRQFGLNVTANADAGQTYPPYIGQRLDRPSEKRASTFNQYLVELPAGSQVRWIKLDGEFIDAPVVTIAGRSFVEAPFEIYAGQRRKLVVNFWGDVRGWRIPGQSLVPVSCPQR